jgi:hypothetical protein
MDCHAFRDDLLDVLYGEADAPTRARFDRHQQDCAGCRAELAALRGVRRDLAAWPLPAALRPRPLARASAWRPLAVAAGVLLALGAALGLSGSELRYGPDRVAFRLGRAAGTQPDPRLEQRLAALEARHRQEMQALRHELAGERAAAEAALAARVASLVRDSEARQAVLVGASVATLRDEVAAQRRYDLAQVGAGFSYLEGKTGLQAARTTELMGHVLQAAQKR